MSIAAILDLFPSFIPGPRLIDGQDLINMANQLFSAKSGIVALAGGGQVGATQLTAVLNQVDTSGAGNTDSVMLPVALPGANVIINNNTANTIQVFGQVLNPNTGVGDTIAASNSITQQPTGTGVSQATAVCITYNCIKAGQWKQN